MTVDAPASTVHTVRVRGTVAICSAHGVIGNGDGEYLRQATAFHAADGHARDVGGDDPALATLQTVLNYLYPAFVAWVDDGVPDPPGTALMAALAAEGYVLAPAERVLVGAGQVTEE